MKAKTKRKPGRKVLVHHTATKRIRAESSEGMVRTSIAIPEALHRRFKLASIETGAVVTELLRRAAADWIQRYEATKKGGTR